MQVYRVPEPLVSTAGGPTTPVTLGGVDRLTFVYPDGPHDAEALVMDPTNRQLFVITKDPVGGVAQVYRAPANLPDGSTTVLTAVGSVSLGGLQGVTSADVTPAGDVVALRTYLAVFLFPRPAGQTLPQAFSQAQLRGRGAAVRERDERGGTPG